MVGGSSFLPLQAARLVTQSVCIPLISGNFDSEPRSILTVVVLQAGFSILRLFWANQWNFLLIDHRTPVFVESGTRVFTSCCDPKETWAPLIEKVHALLLLLLLCSGESSPTWYRRSPSCMGVMLIWSTAIQMV